MAAHQIGARYFPFMGRKHVHKHCEYRSIPKGRPNENCRARLEVKKICNILDNINNLFWDLEGYLR
jgi:hypothetical protein